MRAAFQRKERVAFYSVSEETIFLFSMRDGNYQCRKARVDRSRFWESAGWKAFDEESAHLIIDPAPERGPGFFKAHLVKAFVVYLTSLNEELKKFQDQAIKDLSYQEFL